MSLTYDQGMGKHGSALVVVDDERIALATVLVLQEMNFSVDVALEPLPAVKWARRARYEVIVCGPGDSDTTRLALRLRNAAPRSRVVLLAGSEGLPEDLYDLEGLRVEVVQPPLDVNRLIERFWPAAA
jgi:DNA-binding response OmpR family regulator